MLITRYTLLTLCNTVLFFPSSMPNYSFIICDFLFLQYFQIFTVLYQIPLINFIAYFCCQNLQNLCLFPLCAVAHIHHPKPSHDAVFTPIQVSQNPHLSTCPPQNNVTRSPHHSHLNISLHNYSIQF